MGYKIVSITNFETLDFSELDQEKNLENLRISNDGLLFVVSGENITDMTENECYQLMLTDNWLKIK